MQSMSCKDDNYAGHQRLFRHHHARAMLNRARFARGYFLPMASWRAATDIARPGRSDRSTQPLSSTHQWSVASRLTHSQSLPAPPPAGRTQRWQKRRTHPLGGMDNGEITDPQRIWPQYAQLPVQMAQATEPRLGAAPRAHRPATDDASQAERIDQLYHSATGGGDTLVISYMPDSAHPSTEKLACNNGPIGW